MRGARAHHLDRAAREPERGGPHRVCARPVHEVFDARGEEVVVDRLEAHYAAFLGLVRCRAATVAAGSRPSRPGAPTARRTVAPTRVVDLLHRTPLERAGGEEIGERHEQHEQEDAHGDEAVGAEPAEHRGERIEEDDLDVEDDERHRDQVELHREALGRLVLGHDAALVRRFLRRRRPLRPEELRGDERQGREQHDQHDHAEDRQVDAHARPLPFFGVLDRARRHDRRWFAQAIRTARDDACSIGVALDGGGQTSSSDLTRSKRSATSGQLTMFQKASTQSAFTFLYCR